MNFPTSVAHTDAACKQLAALAVTALLEEAALFPKPGLVDPVSQGAHTDMDFTTLVRSAAALRQGFYECARIGYDSLPRSVAPVCATQPDCTGESPRLSAQPTTASAHATLPIPGQPATAVPMQPDCTGGAVSAVRKQLQRTGLALEQAMFAETGGINTHKGAIFIFAYLLGAAGRLLHADHRSLSVSGGQHQLTAALCAEVQRLAAGSVAEWKTQLAAKQHYTHGERMFLQYGCCGIRGEVEAGLPLVNRNAAYPEECTQRLQQCTSGQLPQRDAHLYTLLHIIAENEDTNVLFRAGAAALRDLQTRCSAILNSGLTGTALYHAVEELDAYCIQQHISPGGSADIFAAVLFCRSAESLYPHLVLPSTALQ
ncbi:MAG: triphosphoribosyl-dephospho-CoA synthase [Treponema sp.]|uniref:triphosphoribosyl-dephospho-CoA synthase n=1 Tax=Treponema sp. TaxID=166 RepID=UPI003FA2BD05